MGKKIGVMIVLALGLAALPVFADGITFTVNGTYDSTTSTTVFSAPTTSFSLAFSEPLIVSLLGPTSVPVTFTMGSTVINEPSTAVNVMFFDSADGGLFDVIFTTPGGTASWSLTGLANVAAGTPSGSNLNLMAGLYTIDPSSFFDTSGDDFGSVSGTVTAVSTTAVPEPPAGVLLLGGLLGLAALGLRKRSCDASAA